MPILVAGVSTRVNRSGIVILSSQQPCIGASPTRQTCNRLIIPPGVEPAPASTYPITDNGNTQVLHAGSGAYTFEKISGAASTFNASAVSSIGVAGDFVLRISPALIFGHILVGMNSDPLTDNDYASIDYAWGDPGAGGAGALWESGVNVAAPGITTDYFWIWRIGTSLNYGRGATLAAAQVTPDRTVAGVSSTLYFDSSLYDVGDKAEVLLATLPASLTAAVGSYTITGIATALTTARKLTVSVGSYALNGTAIGLKFGHNLPATPGAYAISGVATGAPIIARKLIAAVGSYAISGQATALRVARRLTAAAGAYVITGQAVGLRRGFTLTAAIGSYAITGAATGLKAARRMAAAVGAYVITGQTTGLKAGPMLAAAVGSYIVSGQTVALKVARKLAAAVGVYTVSGQAAGLAGQRKLGATAGAYAYTGQAVALSFGHFQGIIAALGAYVITGMPIAFAHVARLIVRPGRYNYYGYPVTLRLVRISFIPNNVPADAALVFSLLPGTVSVVAAALPPIPPSVGAAAIPPPNAFVRVVAPPAAVLEN